MPMVADVADAVIGGDTHKDTHTLEIATPSGVPLASIVLDHVVADPPPDARSRWPGSPITRPDLESWWG